MQAKPKKNSVMAAAKISPLHMVKSIYTLTHSSSTVITTIFISCLLTKVRVNQQKHRA